MTDSSDMKRVEFVILGIFLALYVQSQLGLFDKFYDSLLVSLALQDQTAWARAVYHLLGQHEFASHVRAENPIGFFVLNGVFCAILAEIVSIPIRVMAFGFGMLGKAVSTGSEDAEETQGTPSALAEPTRV